MKVFDLSATEAHPYEQRDRNVFYQTGEFKTRIIELSAGGEIPECRMSDHVIFLVLNGKTEVTVNLETVVLSEKQCLITPPATISMKTQQGVRLMGIQIAENTCP